MSIDGSYFLSFSEEEKAKERLRAIEEFTLREEEISGYFPFKVVRGSCYVIILTNKVKSKISGKEYYLTIMLRKIGRDKGFAWKLVKSAKWVRQWKAKDKVREWISIKGGGKYSSKKSSGRNISEKRRNELKDRGIDLAGKKHNLPVFLKKFICKSCGHEWFETTNYSGCAECPSCSFTFIHSGKE